MELEARQRRQKRVAMAHDPRLIDSYRAERLKRGGLASRAVVVEATAAADVLMARPRGRVDGFEACVSENAHFYKAGPDRSRALLISRV